MNASERNRVIKQFMACSVHGPEWKLPPFPQISRSTTVPSRARKVRLITAFGKTQALYLWAKEVGLKPKLIANRIDGLHWNVEEALLKGAKK